MELITKDGKRVLTLNQYGFEWGMTYVNGGCDEAMIDTGDSSAFNDFFSYLRNESDLSEASIDDLEKSFFEDRNWAVEVEDGAKEALEENGYIETNEYFYERGTK